MLTEKDLQAVSSLMDESLERRFKIELSPIHDRLSSLEDGQRKLEDGQKKLEDGQRKLEDGQKKLEDRVQTLEQDVRGVKQEVREVKQDVRGVKQEVQEVKQEVGEVKQEVREVKQDVRGIHVTLENDIIPRLDTIENCYTSTYYRYQRSVGDYDSMKMDIQILKKVTGEHSKILEELSSK